MSGQGREEGMLCVIAIKFITAIELKVNGFIPPKLEQIYL